MVVFEAVRVCLNSDRVEEEMLAVLEEVVPVEEDEQDEVEVCRAGLSCLVLLLDWS